MNNYVSQKISVSALNRFYAENSEKGSSIHTLVIYKDGECLARIASEPYDCADKRQVYSLSKSFCSTAVGIATDEGLFSLDDRIVDLFPESAPEKISENLAQMTVRHILTMNSGTHTCHFSEVSRADDVAKAFLGADFPSTPGTHFAYDTSATLMLSALVQKYAKMTVLDYLNAKLFGYMNISDVRWQTTPHGICEGGVGIHVSADDIAKLGLLYLNRGMFNGKRLLSEKWISEVSLPHSDTTNNGNLEWSVGYGYQFWNNAREGYRGDGAYGQLCMIFPERQTVIAIQAETQNMQEEINGVYHLVDSMLCRDENSGEDLSLQQYPPLFGETKEISFDGKLYVTEPNPMGVTSFYVCNESDNVMRFVMNVGDRELVIRAGNGYWIYGNRFTAKAMMPGLFPILYLNTERELTGAASYSLEKDCIKICFRLKNSPHTLFYSLSFDRDSATVSINSTTAHGLTPECKILKGREAQICVCLRT